MFLIGDTWYITCYDINYQPEFNKMERHNPHPGHNPGSPNANICLAPLVYSYGHSPQLYAVKITGILNAGCLLSLQIVGMGLFHWTYRASQALSIPLVDLIRYMATKANETTNLALIGFMKDYVGSQEYSWRWSKLFYEGAFKPLGVKSNLKYTYVMVAVVAGSSESSPLWDIISLAGDGSAALNKNGIKVSRALYKLVQMADARTSQTEEARHLGKVMEGEEEDIADEHRAEDSDGDLV